VKQACPKNQGKGQGGLGTPPDCDPHSFFAEQQLEGHGMGTFIQHLEVSAPIPSKAKNGLVPLHAPQIKHVTYWSSGSDA